jgi:hypothetical protein
VGSIGAVAGHRERELAVGAGAGLLILLPSLLVGIHPLVALVAAVGTGAAVVATSRLLVHRDDPLAPLPFESWLAKHPEEWPWWLLGGIVGVIALLLLPSFRASLPLLVVGGLTAATPWVRQQLDDCGRVRAS